VRGVLLLAAAFTAAFLATWAVLTQVTGMYSAPACLCGAVAGWAAARPFAERGRR
jgi:hypothetical protein